ncbi:hypothetical protein SVAN01_02774 [Stagonosporopsis vannaccii]|nr:hypothetical protein SVAN01_02774 [Stagonosporopsis vannaccii]
MFWITQLVVALWVTANNYAWYAADPVAKFALLQANCWFPSSRCLQQAKAIAVQVIADQTDLYWCALNEEIARREHDGKAKEDHDRYIAEQLAKGGKWDRWEVSPPTIIDQSTNINIYYNRFINPTLVSVCAPPSQIPGLDTKALVARHRPSTGSELTIDAGLLETSIIHTWTKQVIILFFIGFMLWRVIFWISALVRCICHQFFSPFPSPPSLPKSSSLPTPKKPFHLPSDESAVTSVTRKSTWPPKNGKYPPVTGMCRCYDIWMRC